MRRFGAFLLGLLAVFFFAVFPRTYRVPYRAPDRRDVGAYSSGKRVLSFTFVLPTGMVPFPRTLRYRYSRRYPSPTLQKYSCSPSRPENLRCLVETTMTHGPLLFGAHGLRLELAKIRASVHGDLLGTAFLGSQTLAHLSATLGPTGNCQVQFRSIPLHAPSPH